MHEYRIQIILAAVLLVFYSYKTAALCFEEKLEIKYVLFLDNR